MGKDGAALIVAGEDAGQALAELYKEQGYYVAITPPATPGDFLEGMKKALGEAYGEVRVVTTTPMALGTGVYEVPTLNIPPGGRGRVLSVEELKEKFAEGGVRTMAVVGPEVFDALKGVGLTSPLGERLSRGANAPAEVVVTRHPGLAEFLEEAGVAKPGAPVVPHASKEDVSGKVVAGILPPALAAEADAVVSVPPLGVGMTVELTKEEVAKVLEEKGFDPKAPIRYALLDMSDPKVYPDLVLLYQEAKEKGLERLKNFTESLASTPLPPKLSEVLKAVAKEALEDFERAQTEAVADGKTPWPSPAENALENFLREVTEREGTLTLKHLYVGRELSEAVYEQTKMEGANAWAAAHLARSGDLAYRLQDSLQRESSSLEPGA